MRRQRKTVQAHDVLDELIEIGGRLERSVAALRTLVEQLRSEQLRWDEERQLRLDVKRRSPVHLVDPPEEDLT